MLGQPFAPSCAHVAQQLLMQCSPYALASNQSLSVPRSLLLVLLPREQDQCLSSTVVPDGYRSMLSTLLGSSLADMRSRGRTVY